MKYKLNPNLITGFVDAEGCFMININKQKIKSEWKIQACFQIKLHYRDKELLMKIKSFFNNIGKIYTRDTSIDYVVRSLDEITKIIIPHFDKYPLITRKYSDFIIFKNIVELMNKGEHLNKDGLIKIVNLKASLNKGLSNELKINFPNTIKVERPKVNIPMNINYNWIAGFMSGDGCFSVAIYKSDTYKVGYRVKLQIIFSQHSRDDDICKIMIPLFSKDKIIGIKSLDYLDFCKVAELGSFNLGRIKKKIRKIKFNMNKRKYKRKNYHR